MLYITAGEATASVFLPLFFLSVFRGWRYVHEGPFLHSPLLSHSFQMRFSVIGFSCSLPWAGTVGLRAWFGLRLCVQLSIQQCLHLLGWDLLVALELALISSIAATLATKPIAAILRAIPRRIARRCRRLGVSSRLAPSASLFLVLVVLLLCWSGRFRAFGILRFSLLASSSLLRLFSTGAACCFLG